MPAYVKVPRNEQVLRRFGPYPSMMFVGNGATSLQRNVRDHGLCHWEPGTQATLLSLVETSTQRPVQFFDVGAHVAMHSAVVATVYGAGVEVTAFEPTPRTADIARSIAAGNRLPLRIERFAVSDEPGVAELYISPWDTSNSLRQGFRPAKESVAVPLVTLDAYCAERDAWPSVMKIDVETLEAKVLAGALGMLERARTAFVCEILAITDRAITERLLASLDGLGYHPHRWTLADGWTPCTSREVLDQVEHDGLDWLFTPEPLPADFAQVLRRWREAVADCKPTAAKKMRTDRTNRPWPRYVALDHD